MRRYVNWIINDALVPLQSAKLIGEGKRIMKIETPGTRGKVHPKKERLRNI